MGPLTEHLVIRFPKIKGGNFMHRWCRGSTARRRRHYAPWGIVRRCCCRNPLLESFALLGCATQTVDGGTQELFTAGTPSWRSDPRSAATTIVYERPVTFPPVGGAT